MPPDDGLLDAALARGAEIKSAVEQRFQKHVPSVPVWNVADQIALLGGKVAEIARTQDICVSTLFLNNDKRGLISSTVDGILLGATCGVLSIPESRTVVGPFKRVTIAWNASKEASRAVAEAMPLIQSAQAVYVVLVDPELRQAGKELRPGTELMTHLRHHGIDAALSRVSSGHSHISDAILAEAGRLNSDLLVIGAQAAGGLLQWFQGSVSREILAASSIPLFLAH
jgi:nucleotide-binding universal stress UspA family protein